MFYKKDKVLASISRSEALIMMLLTSLDSLYVIQLI